MKADFLQECMSDFKNVPIDAFNREYCVLCSNRECTRSWGNISRFDNRVKNWRKVLFEDVPRVNDPSIANPGFTPVDPGAVPEIHTTNFETVEPPEAVQMPKTQETPIKEKPAPTPKTAVDMNTQFDGPVMIGGQKLPDAKTEEKAQPGCVFVFDDDE